MLVRIVENLQSMVGPWLGERETIRRSGLFDENWYNEKFPPAKGQSADAIDRYLSVGAAKGHRPHPLFDVDWYLRSNPDAASSRLSPLGHFIKVGSAKAASPHPLFDPTWYRAQTPSLNADSKKLFLHFVSDGARQGLSPHPAFDSSFYLAAHPQLAANGINPLTHYVEIGASQGFAPNAYFDSRWYVETYPEAPRSGENPLVHFICHGVQKGFRPHPQVDVELYISTHEEAPSDPLAAYLEFIRAGEPFNAVAIDASETTAAKTLKVEILETGRDRSPSSPIRLRDLESFASAVSEDDIAPIAHPTGTTAALSKAMEGAAAVSFDVWDTLLRRDCHPDEIKLQSARFLIFNAFPYLRPAFCDIIVLLRARLDAERRSSPSPDSDFRLRDAIASWLAQVLKPQSHAAQAKLLTDKLIAHEIRAEKRCMRADLTISKFLPSVGIPMVFASDHYFSNDQIRELLDEVELSKFFPTGYVSSELGVTKRAGTLYDHVLDSLSLSASQLVHVGDRQATDVETPSAKGIVARHYTSPSEERRQAWFAEAFEARLAGNLNLHWRRIVMLLEALAKEYEINLQDKARAAGVRLSPIFISFVLRIVVDAVGRNADCVYFFRREGIFLKKLYQAVQVADPFNVETPAAELLDVSRTATFVASMTKLTPQELMRMWHQYDAQSFGALAMSLGLDEGVAADAAARSGLDYTRIITKPWQHEDFCAALSDAALQQHAENHFARQRALLLSYLRNKKFMGETKTSRLVVDIGWRGTIQDSLHQVSGMPIAGHYLALFKYLAPQAEGSIKHGWLGDENKGDALNIPDVAALEAICCGAGGTVAGYHATIDGVSPTLVSIPEEEEVITERYARIQEGILAAVAPICDYVRAHGLTPEDLLGVARDLADTLVSNPPQCVADAFFSLKYNETFGNGTVYDFTSDDLLAALKAKQETSALHARAEAALSAVRWPAGVARTSKVVDWYRTSPAEKQLSLPTSLFRAQLGTVGNVEGAKLVVYSPPPMAASGGHRTLFRIVKQLARLGFDTHIMVENVGEGFHVLEEYLEYQPVTFHPSWQKASCDLALASIARSAHYVAELPDARHRAYLVQDFEALFDPMGDGYINGENSYARGLQHLTIGNWLTHVIGVQYGLPCGPAGLGVDTGIYRPDGNTEREFAVCVLYQPEKSRRTPLFVAEALQILSRRLPKLKIYAFGSSRPLPIDGNVENLGSISNLNDLRDLYSKCIAGFCPSSSNPSRIPYEMMAAGCVPVDLYRYNNLLDFREGTALLAYQSPASVAAALAALLSDATGASKRSEACIKFASSRTEQWETDVICNHVLAQMAGRTLALGEINLPNPYADGPIIATIDDLAAVRRFCEWQRSLAEIPLRGLGVPQSISLMR